MLTFEEIDQLSAVGLIIERRNTDIGPRWFVGALGPYKSPEEALVAGVRWLVQQMPPPQDEPPGPFKSLLG